MDEKEQNNKKKPVVGQVHPVSQNEDIISYEETDGKSSRVKTFFMKNNKKNLKRILLVLLALVLALVAAAGIYVGVKLGLIGGDDPDSFDPEATFTEDEDINVGEIHDITDASSLNDLLYQWATNNGPKMKSKNVINVLLIGTNEKLSDAIILASVNKTTKQIILTSIMRDSYTFMNIKGSGRFDKLNHSHSWSGPEALIETLENNYKIEIDHYVGVDIDSFPGLIDALGGVTVAVTKAESNYMYRTKRMSIPVGDAVKLNGNQALWFSRIRKLDSDEQRTRRQRLVIESIIASAKGANVSQLNKAINMFLPYVTTNYSNMELLSLGTQALTEGWLNYTIINATSPSEANRKGTLLTTYSGAGRSVWIVDYPLEAQAVQKLIYGQTNIQIDPENHTSALGLLTPSTSRRPSGSGVTTTSPAVNPSSNPTDTSQPSDTTTEPADTTEDTSGETTTRGSIIGPWWPTTTQPGTEPTDANRAAS